MKTQIGYLTNLNVETMLCCNSRLVKNAANRNHASSLNIDISNIVKLCHSYLHIEYTIPLN